MALRKADISEFFAEFTRFIIFTGFFWWLLTNGPDFAESIFDSLRQIAGNATKLGSSLTPSGIVDIGFEIFSTVLDKSSVWSPVDSALGVAVSLIILVILALVGINMLLLLISAWILAYAGIFFLGFGGSRWTSEIAINYFKTVLSIAAQLMGMVLLIGIGKTFLDDYYNSMSEGITLSEMGVILIVTIILYVLTNKIPQMLAGIPSGASVGLGGGASMGAALAAGGLVGGAIMSSITSIAGDISAIREAIGKKSDSSGESSNNDSASDMIGFSGDNNTSDSEMQSPFSPDSLAGTSSFSGGSDSGGGDSGGGDSKGKSKSTASSVLGGAAKNLAHGISAVAANKVAEMKANAKASIAETTGGKIATAIRNQRGGVDGWESKEGGFDKLSNADQNKALKAFTQWKSSSSGNSTTSLREFVAQKQFENEISSFVDKN